MDNGNSSTAAATTCTPAATKDSLLATTQPKMVNPFHQ